MKKLIFILTITTILFLWNRNKVIQLDFYQKQNLIVRNDFGFEVETYHPTKNDVNYCFNNVLFKTCFRKHE